MDNLKKYISKLDMVLILTIISYSVVYCYNLGVIEFYNIPGNFIELGVNNITDTLLVLCMLLIIFVPIIIDFSKIAIKRLIVFTVFLILYDLYSWFINKVIPSSTLIILGCLIIYVLRNLTTQLFTLCLATLYVLFASIFLGWSISYNVNTKATDHDYFELNGKKYLIVRYYKDFYITTKLISNNKIKYEYQLIPIDEKNGKNPILLKQMKIKIDFID